MSCKNVSIPGSTGRLWISGENTQGRGIHIMRYWSLPRRVAQVCLAICYLVAITPHASATQQTIPLNVSLDDVLSVNATVTVLQSQITNGQLTLTATISGTAVVNGISATVSSQPLTVTASATCKGGSGTLILTTSSIQLSLSKWPDGDGRPANAYRDCLLRQNTDHDRYGKPRQSDALR